MHSTARIANKTPLFTQEERVALRGLVSTTEEKAYHLAYMKLSEWLYCNLNTAICEADIFSCAVNDLDNLMLQAISI